jgi:AcrR family transcriptional regulator
MVSVAQIIARAGVSRPTFYEHFADREDCMLAALVPLRRRLYSHARSVVREHDGAPAAAALAGALTRFAASDPATARMLFSEPLTAGRRALDAHDQMVATLARMLEDADQRLAGTAVITGLPARLLVGADIRLLAQRLSGGQPLPGTLGRELETWLACYARPVSEHRRRLPWPDLARASPLAPSMTMTLSAPLHPRARSGRAPRGRLVEQQRLRILSATAAVVTRVGYTPATVVQISREARLDTHVFYRLFADKQDAFAACGEMLFRQIMAVSAADFAAGESWTERVLRAAAACLGALESSPTLARAVLVDGRSGGAQATRSLHAGARALTIYLQEGFRDQASTSVPSELALEAIAAAILEACYEQLRRDPSGGLSGLLEQVAFVVLAPFLGAAETDDLLAAGTAVPGSRPVARIAGSRLADLHADAA